MSSKRALVTGGSGFIGAALVRRLVADGWTVHVATRPNSTLERLVPGIGQVNVHLVDWADPASVLRIVRAADPAVVYHLAGPPFNPPPPLHAFIEAAVNATAALLEALDATGNEARIVFAGSAATYGDAAYARETDRPEPKTWLGAAKAMAGVLLETAARKTGRPIVELRLYTPYGPAERAERLIPSLVEAARERRTIPLTSGEQERDFVYVDDVAGAFVAAATCRTEGLAAFNIGSGTGTRIRDLVTTVLEMLDATELVRFGALPTRPDEIMRMAADISAAEMHLGWRPTTPLSRGLQSTIDWYLNDALHRV